MPVREPYPELNEILTSIGVAGARVAAIEASEGAAGNISVLVGWPLDSSPAVREPHQRVELAPGGA